MTNIDPKDIPNGFTTVQKNLGNFRPGRLDVRGGVLPLLRYWTDVTAGSGQLLNVFGCTNADSKWVAYQRDDGVVRAIRDGGESADFITGLDTDHPAVMYRDAMDGLLVYNGLERGYRWDGTSSTAELAGVSSPEDLGGNPPTIAENTALAVTMTAGDYIAAYRYMDKYGYPSDITEFTEYTVTTNLDGLSWTSLTPSTQSRVKYIELFRSVVNEPSKLYLVARIGNNGAVPAITGNGVTTTLTLETGHGLIVGASITVPTIFTAKRVATVSATSATVLGSYNSSATDKTFTTVGFFDDEFTDDELLDAGQYQENVLSVFSPDDTIYARSFGLPPDDKPYFAQYQGFTFAYGRVNYSIGTATATAAGLTIVLNGDADPKTEWAGRQIILTATAERYTIISVNEGTNTLTVDRLIPTTRTTVAYVVTPNPQRANLLAFSSGPGYNEAFLSTDGLRIQSTADSTDLETGLMQFGPYLYALHEYHMHQIVFQSHPRLDGQANLAGYRGAVNNRCWTLANGIAYLMDQMGGYRISGPCCPDDITSLAIKNIFKDTVDWSISSKKWYFLSHDPQTRVVRYHVKYTTDTGTMPKRALCYNTQTGEWWEEEYPFELSGSAVIEVDGKQRLVCGGEDDQVLMFGDGVSDWIEEPVRVEVSEMGVATVQVGAVTNTTSAVSSGLIGLGITLDSVGDTVTFDLYATSNVFTGFALGATVNEYMMVVENADGLRLLLDVTAIYSSPTPNAWRGFDATVFKAEFYPINGQQLTVSIHRRTVVDTVADPFTTAMVGASLAIIEGTGKGGTAKVRTRLDATSIETEDESFDWEIDITSVVVVGGIPASLKTGMLALLAAGSEDGRASPVAVPRECRVLIEPTSMETYVALQVFMNYETDPQPIPFSIPSNRGLTYDSDLDCVLINTKSDQFVRGEDPGVKIISLDEPVNDEAISDRHVAISLYVIQGMDAISIRALDFSGYG
jgi:hypothetical protein